MLTRLYRKMKRSRPVDFIFLIIALVMIYTTYKIFLSEDEESTVAKVPQDDYKKSDIKMTGDVDQGHVTQTMNCTTGVPCEYPDEVDLRIIVMTFSRASSLKKILDTIQDLEMDGDKGALEIWIDRDKTKQEVNKDTLKLAESFKWKSGSSRVHVQTKHAGIYGQWIHTWRPKENSKEIALILEDDLSLSKYAWRWLKTAHRKYGAPPDSMGTTLQSEGVQPSTGRGSVAFPKSDPVFLYKRIGSWGFAPNANNWRDFQDWFATARADSSFHPYVDGLVMTSWYKGFEKKNKHDSMWTMWHIYFTNSRSLYCVYNNLRIFGEKTAVLVHRAEKGLHYNGGGSDHTDRLLVVWDEKFVTFPENVVKLDWNAKPAPVVQGG